MKIKTQANSAKGNARFQHRQDAPNLLHTRTKLGCELIWREILDDAVLVEAQRADPDVRALWVALHPIGPVVQRVGHALHLETPRVCARGCESAFVQQSHAQVNECGGVDL